MKFVVVKLREPVRDLVMALNGEQIELRKKPDDPAIKTECGESLVIVTPDVEERKLVVQHNIGAVVDTRIFDPKERDGDLEMLTRERSPRENLLEASLNANTGQIDKLAEFLLREFPKEAGKVSESAVECAIRLLKERL